MSYRRKARLPFIALAVVACVPVALAEAVDAEVFAVVSAGQWQDDTGQGVYRVVVRTQGFEHVSSGVVAEWVADASEAGEVQRLVASQPLVTSGLVSLGIPVLSVMKDRLRVSLAGVNTYESTTPVSCIFDLWPDKTATVVKACG